MNTLLNLATMKNEDKKNDQTTKGYSKPQCSHK